MPDNGYAGEMLLGDRLAFMIDTAREQALGLLPPALAAMMRNV